MLVTIKLLSLIAVIKTVSGYGTGAPEGVCGTMYPQHGFQLYAQDTKAPFKIVPQSDSVEQGKILKVDIISDPGFSFKGFMVRAEPISLPNKIVGTFMTDANDNVKPMNCFERNSGAITHSNNNDKDKITLEWKAPTDFTGDIMFNGTVVKVWNEFWVSQKSSAVRVRSGDQLATTTEFTRPTTSRLVIDDPIYNGCGVNKTCFGIPNNCIAQMNCEAFMSMTPKFNAYVYEMRSPATRRAAFVAVGLSRDANMGDDSVVECVYENGAVNAYTSWTNGKTESSRVGIDQSIIRMIRASYDKGVIYCQVERNAITNVHNQSFDLHNHHFNLLLATGSALKENKVGYHDLYRAASADSFKLSQIRNVSGSSKLMLRLHGVFMVTAWIGTASIGIMMARYFKPSWKGKRLYGKDLWFAGHQICMILTWALTVIAYIIIFVEVGGWAYNANIHAILGTITTVFCFLQPIGAFFRPAPTHGSRKYFNWLHFLGGNTAHIFSIITIFFAVGLAKAELPQYVDFILIAYVCFQFFMHIIFSTLKLRNLPLVMYILVIILFVAALIFTIVTAGMN